MRKDDETITAREQGEAVELLRDIQHKVMFHSSGYAREIFLMIEAYLASLPEEKS